MAAVQAEDARASFLFVGDLNGRHQESFGSITTNRQLLCHPQALELQLPSR